MGAIESRQGTLKNAVEQALLLRGQRHFQDLAEYQCLVADVVTRLNRRVQAKAAEERASLRPLPPRRTSEYEELEVRVTKFGTASVKRILYSVPSRLIGHPLKFRIYAEHVEGWLGGVCVFQSERSVVPVAKQRGKKLDDRHLIPALRKKPGAFARWALRDDLFPRSEYRQRWDCLVENLPEREACKRMVGLLDIAARGACEAQRALVLADLLQAGTLPELDGLEERFAPRQSDLPLVVVLPELKSYDRMLEGAA
jgi:hypothetical protein